MSAYQAMLRRTFASYRRVRYAGRDSFFEERPDGDAVVFCSDHVADNLLIAPFATDQDRDRIINVISPAQRHRHFGSMQSSQALVQSVFGPISVFGLLPLLSTVVAEDGRPAFGPSLNEATIEFEKSIQTLGELRPTSVDVWLEGAYRVAIECKLSEANFGTCSRTRLKHTDPQQCDGSYSRQRGRVAHCALTEIGIHYWDYTDDLFGWSSGTEHRPCPLAPTYQLVRNILAACVREDGTLSVDRGHALVIYDGNNPSMAREGEGDWQWRATLGTLKQPGALRRLSWQDFIAQWPAHPMLDWLKDELGAKYAIYPAHNMAKAS